MKGKITRKNRVVAALLAVIMVIGCAVMVNPFAVSAETADLIVTPSDNSGDNGYVNYDRWAATVKSYLYQEGDNLVRVEYVNDEVIIETYSANLQLLETKSLSLELPLWGGFYAGEDANYIICGQENLEEDDSTEVIRVIKYDKNFNRVGSAGLYGANTTTPFKAGSLRCAEYGGYLYVHTSHEMYAASDGLIHQSNMIFSVRESDMVVTDSFDRTSNANFGYVSHSLNQFVLVDTQNNIITLNHGDGFPRGVMLAKYDNLAGNDLFAGLVDFVYVQSFPGEIGANDTGANVGGLAETSDGYISAFSDNQTGTGTAERNIFISYTPKSDFSKEATVVTKLTNYMGTETADKRASNPIVVPTGLDGGYILWNDIAVSSMFNTSTKLYYVSYSADGSVSDVKSVEGVWLSDCQPICVDGKVVWYTTNSDYASGTPVFYTLDENGVSEKAYAPITNFQLNMDSYAGVTGEKIQIQSQVTPSGMYEDLVAWSSSNELVASVSQDGTVTLNAEGDAIITACFNHDETWTRQVKITVRNCDDLEITSMPTKTSYYTGQQLDLSGLEVTAHFTNGEELVVSDYEVSGFDSNTPGTQTITLSYAGQSVSFTIQMTRKAMTSISVTPPDKTVYWENEKLDTSGMVVTAHYNDGTSLQIANYSVSGFDNTAGTKTITVSYNGFFDTFEVTVNSIELVEISVVSPPTKTTYYRGESLDTSGMRIYAIYNNGDRRTVYPNSISGYEPNVLGPQTVTVTYQDMTASFQVEVISKPISSLTVSLSKDSYWEGSEFDSSTVSVTANYTDGTSATLYSYEYILTTDYNADVPDTYTVTVEYQGVKATAEVTVKEKVVNRFALTAPDKTEYLEGEELDLTGMYGTFYFNTGDTLVIPAEDFTISGYDSSLTRQQIVYATYEYKGETYQRGFLVTVRAKSLTGITAETNKTVYYVGETFDASSLTVIAQYNNGTSEDVTGYSISGFNSSTTGQKTVTVTYRDFTASFQVTVTENRLTGIEITKTPTKTEYFQGESLNLNGLEVMVSYEDGSNETVSGYSVSGFDNANPGLQTITVTYNGFSDTFTVTVKEKQLTGIEITATPNKLNYYVGQSLDLTGMQVMASYNDGTKVQVNDYAVTGYDPAKSGPQTVTVSYGGYSDTFQVNVENKQLTGIEITTLPLNTDYYQGQSLNLTGMVVTASYNDESTAEITDYTVSGFDSSVSGLQTITVSYEGYSDTFLVWVEQRVMSGIQIAQQPNKTIYYANQTEIDATGLILEAVYNDGTTERISEYTVSYVNTVTVNGVVYPMEGDNRIQVSYGIFDVTYNITVLKNNPTGAAITGQPAKTEYQVGDTVTAEDLVAGMEFTMIFENGDQETVSLENVEVQQIPDLSTPGEKTVVVSYRDPRTGATVTSEFTITVVERGSETPEDPIIFIYDINGDGSEDVLDVMTLAQMVVGSKPTENKDQVDYDQNGRIEVLDVMTLAQRIVDQREV